MAQDRQIDNIVPDIGDLLIRQPCFCLDVRIRLTLIKAALINEINPELLRTIHDDGGGAPRNERRPDPHLTGKGNGKPITGKERLK